MIFDNCETKASKNVLHHKAGYIFSSKNFYQLKCCGLLLQHILIQPFDEDVANSQHSCFEGARRRNKIKPGNQQQHQQLKTKQVIQVPLDPKDEYWIGYV